MAVSAGSDGAAAASPEGAIPVVLDARVSNIIPETVAVQIKPAPKSYTVISGDTLSAIAAKFCGSAGKWPSLYHGNHGMIGADPNMILPGQKFTLSCDDPFLYPAAAVVTTAAQVSQSSAPASSGGGAWGVAYGDPNYCGDGDGDGWDVACNQPAAQQSAPVQATAQVTAASGVVGAYPGGAFGQCVVARESGGNAQVMNSSGHYGLYQFSESTWVEYGGSAADFGNASAAQQEQVFSNALAAGGQSNWSPYDGC
jgi:LysM repeat protein